MSNPTFKAEIESVAALAWRNIDRLVIRCVVKRHQFVWVFLPAFLIAYGAILSGRRFQAVSVGSILLGITLSAMLGGSIPFERLGLFPAAFLAIAALLLSVVCVCSANNWLLLRGFPTQGSELP